MVKKTTDTVRQSGQLTNPKAGIRLSDVFGNGLRLEASAYALEARQAVVELRACPYPLKALLGKDGLCQGAHNGTRFSRVYVSEEKGVPFLSSSDIIGLRPERGSYISRTRTTKLDQLLIQPWMVLVSRSGTIGNVSLASPRMTGWALSEDAIRIIAHDRDTAGYIAAFLRSPWGRRQILGVTYGSVIQHIEPAHLQRVLIPDLPAIRRIAIGRAFVDAALKRDEANNKLDEADTRLRAALKLPSLPAAGKESIVSKIRLSDWGQRLDAAFHNPTVRWIEQQLQQSGFPVLPLADKQLTQSINAVTKFRKRVYVPKGGIPLLSSKQLFQIDPIEVKGLAKGAHEKDMAEIALAPNMLAITCSGTIGRVQIIPAYMDGWAANQHALRIIPTDDINAGYLYAWLASVYGQALIARYSYGSVIVEIDRFMVGAIPVPMLSEPERNAIGKLVLEANHLRDEAWKLEQEALAKLRTEIEGTN